MFPQLEDRLQVPYEATEFPSTSGLNCKSLLTLTWEELLWASITVGKARQDVFRSGQYSLAELMHRIASFYAYYCIEDERLKLSSEFTHLDPSEKAIVSFYTGMAMAKLYAGKALGVPWLMHISRYATSWAVRYGARSDRPDLFGCDLTGGWIVAEAKGRNRVSGLLLTKMKNQKSAVATINGTPPLHRFGCASRTEAGRVSLRVVDPPARRLAQEVPLDSAAWLIDYYAPIVDLIDQSEMRHEDGVVVAHLQGTEIEVGLPQETMNIVYESRERKFARPGPRLRRLADQGIGVRRPLSAQTDETNQDVVERFATSAERGREMQGGFADGVVLRAFRG
jgi:hypothetical protein